MKELESVLNIVSEGLKTLAKGVEAIAEKVEEVAKSQHPVQPKSKKPSSATAKKTTAKKKAGGTESDTDKVLGIIAATKDGASTAVIMQKTGYNQKKIANVIYRLRKQQKIKSVAKGVYTRL